MPRRTGRERLQVNWEYAIPQVETADRTQAGGPPMDSEAFSGFYERSARSLWAYLARVSGNPALADDLMQEAYLRFLGAAGRTSVPADGEVACRRYLFRIATNLLRDHWRRPAATSLEEVPEALLAASDRVGQSDALAMLGPALKQMRPRDRQ